MSETVSTGETFAPEGPSLQPSATPSIGQDVKAGLLGLAISVGCLFLIIPIVHIIAALSGPAIGGFFASARIRARGRHTLAIGATIGIGEAIAVAIIASIMLAFGLIAKDSTSALFVAGIDVMVLLYATGLGTLGAYFGGRGEPT